MQNALIPPSHEKYKDTDVKGAILKCDQIATSSGRLCHLCHLCLLCLLCHLQCLCFLLLMQLTLTVPLMVDSQASQRVEKNSNSHPLIFLFDSVPTEFPLTTLCPFQFLYVPLCHYFFALDTSLSIGPRVNGD